MFSRFFHTGAHQRIRLVHLPQSVQHFWQHTGVDRLHSNLDHGLGAELGLKMYSSSSPCRSVIIQHLHILISIGSLNEFKILLLLKRI